MNIFSTTEQDQNDLWKQGEMSGLGVLKQGKSNVLMHSDFHEMLP